jgi:hypothetical protein
LGTCKTDGTSSIATKSLEESLKLFPIPANDRIIVQSSENYLVDKLILCNAFGQVISEVTSNEMDVKNYPNGVYFMKVISSENEVVKKILINH